MSKRKRDEDDKHSQEGKLRIRQRQLEGAIDLGKKNVFRALKIGRGFERQKLGRRQKAAKGKQAEGDITRLIVEVAVLKVSPPTREGSKLKPCIEPRSRSNS